jgi:hypothetical protein
MLFNDVAHRSGQLQRLMLRMLVLAAGAVQAHTVPSLVLESEFQADGRYVMKANVDPRLFLAAVPSNLPPVAASWYLDQTPVQRQATEAQATAYLRQTVKWHFGGRPIDLPAMTWTAMDGATNEALKPESAETHLLGEVQGVSPAADLRVHLAANANTSVILLTRVGSTDEKRPIVLFPGETSPAITVPVPPVIPPSASPRPPGGMSTGLLLVIGVLVLGLGAELWRRKPRPEAS